MLYVTIVRPSVEVVVMNYIAEIIHRRQGIANSAIGKLK